MGENSAISWTHHTYNPWIGCTKVSQGCKFCYAERDNTRYQWNRAGWGPQADRKRTNVETWTRTVHKWDFDARQAGERRRVFCASLADVFDDHPSIHHEWRWDLFNLIEDTPHLDWLLLTKRPENIDRMIAEYTGDYEWRDGLQNIWIGVSVEDQRAADERIPLLLATAAAVKFLSCEPLLGPVNINPFVSHQCDCKPGPCDRVSEFGPGVDWVICGGESGPQARPMNPEWARDLLRQCDLAGVPFFMKQMGGPANNKRGEMNELPEDLRVREFPEEER